MITNNSNRQTVALVVDDEIVVCKALRRILSSSFDKVITTTSREQANRILEVNLVTHLVCDCSLGEGQPLGFQLIPGWRKLCPTIKRAVIFSGTDLTDKIIPKEVDAILPKNASPRELIDALTSDVERPVVR